MLIKKCRLQVPSFRFQGWIIGTLEIISAA
jgi:hypothetical protein